MGLGGQSELARRGARRGARRRSDPARRRRPLRRRRDGLPGDVRALHRRIEGGPGASRPALDDEICRHRAEQGAARAGHGRGRLERARMGERPLEARARRRANGCAPRPIRSRAAPARSSSASSPSASSSCREPDRCRSISPTIRRCCAIRRASFMAEEGAIAKQLRHWRDTGCKDGFGHALVEAVRRDGLHRHPDRRGGWRARARPCRGRDRARGDRPQPDALALPDQRGRLRRGAEGHGRCASAGIRASSPATRSRALAIDEGAEAPARGDRDARRALGQRLQPVRRASSSSSRAPRPT